ncbi:MAG: DUF2953 domain-containing protein [Prevotella sp.]|nr:DUF2953 domain-containing protein [Prevotella sp.]
MTALIIIAAVILFFALILNIKLRAAISYMDGKLDFRLKYLSFTVYPLKAKKPKPGKEKKSRSDKAKRKKKTETVSETEESPVKADGETGGEKSGKASESADAGLEKASEAEDASGEKPRKEKLSDKLDKLSGLIEKAKLIWGFSGKRLRRIFTHIYIEKLMIDFTVAGEDACKAAVSYGAVSAAVYNGIAVLGGLFTTKVKSVDIVCDFDRKEPVYNASVNITVRPSTLLSAAFGILGGFVMNYKAIFGKSDKRQSIETAA